MSLFDNVDVNEEVEVEEQSVKVAQSWIKESGTYDVTIEMFRYKQSDNGANGFVIDMITDSGAKITEEEWFSNRTGGTTYVGKKDGKTHNLPGMNKLMNISRALTGDTLAFKKTEEKVVGIYSYDKKADVDTKVDVFTEAIGKKVTVLVQRELEDKTKLNPASGKYEPIAEFKAINNIVAWVDTDTRKTFNELASGSDAKSYEAFIINITKAPVKDRRKASAGMSTETKPKETVAPSEDAQNAFN